MAENSHISWTDNTHNEWLICTKISPGCDNCYAERLVKRFGKDWGKGVPRTLTSEANRRKPYAWDRRARKEGRRIRVFTASLSDVFDEEVPDAWRDGLFRTMFDTPDLDWLVLTKRLAKMRRYLAANAIPPNAWWGCSVEDQATADQRIPELLKLRAIVGDAPLWLSVEPLIGPVNIDPWITNGDECLYPIPGLPARGIDWVIVGGESGPGARPMHPEWARSLRDQCVAAGVAFHFKQWGEWMPFPTNTIPFPPEVLPEIEKLSQTAALCLVKADGQVIRPFCFADGPGVQMVRVGKKAAGRLLDGREWNEFPKINTMAEV